MTINDQTTPFDKQIDRLAHTAPHRMRDALIHAHDTLKICWTSAQTIFGDAAKPEHALAIFDRVEDRRQDMMQEDEDSQNDHKDDNRI